MADTQELEKQIEELTKEIKNLGSEKGTFEKLKKQSDAASQNLKQFGTNLLKGSVNLSDYSSILFNAIGSIGPKFAVAAAVLGAMTVAVERQVEVFRQLSTVGADFGDSLFDSRLAAATAGISLETFTTAVVENSRSLALLGGSASTGAKRFAQISGRIQKDFGPQLSRLGLTMEETTDGVASYLEIQTQLGNAQKMSNDELVAGAGEFLLELDLLARVTGLSRKQLMEQMQQQQQDARIKALLMSMDEKTRKNTQSILAAMGDAPPELKNAVQEMIATGGVPFSKAGKMIMMAAPEMADALGRLGQGGASVEEVFAAMRASSGGMGDMARSLAVAGFATGDASYAAAAQLQTLANIGLDYGQSQIDQQKAMESGGKAVADFQRTMQQLVNLIAVVLNPVIKIFSTLLGAITVGLGKLISFFEDAFGKGIMSNLATMGAVLTGVIIGLVGVVAGFKGLTMVMAALTKTAMGKLAVDTSGKAITGFKSFLGMGPKAAPAGGGSKQFTDAVGPKTGGAMEGFATGLKAFGNPKVLAGAVVFAKVLAIVGVGVAAFIAIVGLGLGVFLGQLEKIQAIDGDKLKEVASGAKAIAGAIGSLAVAPMLGSLKAGVFAKNINSALESIDKTKIDTYTESLNNLSKSIENVQSGLGQTVTAGQNQSNNTVEKLNITMEEILDVLRSGARYQKQTAENTAEG